MDLLGQGVINSGCSRRMTWNMSYLTDYEDINGGYVSFGGNPKGGKITKKAKKSFWSTAIAKTINEEAQLHAKVDGKKIIVTELSVKRDLRLEDEEGEAVHKELGDRLVLDLEKTTTTKCNEIASLKRRVKKLEKKNKSRTHRLKRLYKVGLTARVESFDNEENLVDAAQVSTATITITITTKEITLAQEPKALKPSKPKVKGIVFQELGKSTTTTIYSQQSQDKGKGIMIEEPMKPKKKDQIRLDEETAKKLQAEFDEEERLAKINDDHQLAKRMQAQEQEELSIEEKATLLQQLLEKRRQHFAAKRAEKKKQTTNKSSIEKDNTIEQSWCKEKKREQEKSWSKRLLRSKRKSLRIKEVFGSILLVMVKLLMKKLDDFKEEYQVEGRIVGIKSLLNAVGITIDQVYVNTALMKLKKIVSQLAVFGENISQEDLNLKLLRSLPSEWNTHVVVWRNKLDLDTVSFDDLTTISRLLNKSTNEVNTAYGVSTANTQKTSRKITINGSDTTGYDKSKVECFNCHKLGHFTRECRQPRNQDSKNRNQDSSRGNVNVEETSFKAMVAIDGAGFNWIYMADDKVPTNMALIDFLDSESLTNLSSI
nr:hypothetical protein [Tanacetum cinerariifolium]